MKMKLVAVSMAVASMVALTSVPAWAKGEKGYYVDVARIFKEHKGVQEGTKKYENEVKEKKTLIDTKKEEVTKLREEFEAKKAILSEPEKEKKSEEINEKVKELQEYVRSINADLQQKLEELNKKVVAEIRQAIQEEAEKRKADFIFDKDDRVVLYGNPELDITDEIIKKVNN